MTTLHPKSIKRLTVINMINLLIVDDHPALLEGLSRRLSDEADITIIGRALNGEEAVQMATNLRPNVVVLDIALPLLDGLEVTRLIKVSSPQTAILVFSAYGYESYILGALRAGASGYLLKDITMEELVNAIRIVNRGQSVYDFRAAKDIMRHLSERTSLLQISENELRERELQVLKLAAKGATNKEIAIALSISRRTVQAHLAHIFRKLNVNSRTEAILSALKNGWLSTHDLP